MENNFQEFSGYHGTLINPYPYWLCSNQDCPKCPYHIKTGEESRVTYGEFYEAFGFPYGPTVPENKQLIFFELKNVSGAVIQKGHVTNCLRVSLHAESILFELNGYLDSLLYRYETVGYITLYSNYTPCNEYDHYCISKMYDLLMRYPQTRLDIYFSQLYHIEDNISTSIWNGEALKSLAGLWSRVTLNPISNGIWQTILYTFVKGVPSETLYQPILPARATADRYNAHMIQVITGIKPYFVDVPSPMHKPQNINCYQELPKNNINYIPAPQPQNSSNQYAPFFGAGTHFPGAPVFPFQREEVSKPKNIVRHIRMPIDMSEEMKLGTFLPNTRKINEVVITENVIKEKDKDRKKKRKTKKGKS
ncbi:putative C-_U-editing enzyme APOBEC-4 [Bombina bombina]|uniref:putative C->U-editing enzyme APOBEC-4 n=1 Tax=Bombina bombina TaxID=8345 RepID=UPI00235AF3A0|nr:putative C->U-editing enzyme APOBEC-4 [Bombina bombina]